MNATELRIGNFYAIAESDGIKYKQVTELRIESIGIFCGNDNLTLAAKPIPIDKHWLKRFNFYKDNKRSNHYYNDIIYENKIRYSLRYMRGLFTLFVYAWSEMAPVVDIYYVHQLQNLYNILSGEELLINYEN